MSEKFGSLEEFFSFTKLQSNGNDFVILDATEKEINIDREFISRLADRKRGVGFDQLLLLEENDREYIDFGLRIFNADGSETAQCVNGVRAMAHYVFENKKVLSDFVVFQLKNQINRVYREKDWLRTDLAPPIFHMQSIPMKGFPDINTYNFSDKLIAVSSLTPVVSKEQVDFFVLSVGNPHIVSIVDEFDDELFFHWGKFFQNISFLPEKANFSMAKILSRSKIRLRTFERGVGETESCGSASVASFVALKKLNLIENNCQILNLKDESLIASWDSHLSIKGQTKLVYTGVVNKDLNIKSLSDLKTHSQDDFRDA